MIHLKEALSIINASKKSKDGCEIEFVQLDKARGSGGVVKTLRGCRSTGANHDEWDHGTITVNADGGDHPYNIHIRLMLKINGQIVAG